MSNMNHELYDWVPERFYEGIKNELESKGEYKLNWGITKSTMIYTLNYFRNKYKLKCEWIEKGEDDFLIKITKP